MTANSLDRILLVVKNYRIDIINFYKVTCDGMVKYKFMHHINFNVELFHVKTFHYVP